MRRTGLMSVIGLVAMAAGGIASPSMQPQAIVRDPRELMLEGQRVKRQRQAVAAGSLTKYQRGKRAQAKPKRRSNRLHVGKRVRRSHRRAA